MPLPHPSLLPTPMKRNLSDWGERSCPVLKLSVKSDSSAAQGPKEVSDTSSVQSLWEDWVQETASKVQIFKSGKWKIPETTSCNIPCAATPWSALWLEWPWVCNVTLAVWPHSGAPRGGTAESSLCHKGNCTTHPAFGCTWKLGGFWGMFAFGMCLLQHRKAGKDCHGNYSQVFFQCFPILPILFIFFLYP